MAKTRWHMQEPVSDEEFERELDRFERDAERLLTSGDDSDIPEVPDLPATKDATLAMGFQKKR